MQRRFHWLVALLLLAVILTVVAADAATITPRIRVPLKPAPEQQPAAAQPQLQLRPLLPSRLVFTPFAPFQSGWASPLPGIDGVAGETEWGSAPRLNFAHGSVRIQNGLSYIYLLLDVTADTTNDPLQPNSPWGDYFWLSWDVNGDRNVTPDVDVLYGIYPGTNNLGICHYVEPGAVTPLEPSGASLARGFGATPGSATPHRFWEVAIPLDEIGADAMSWAEDPLDAHPLRLGFHVHSEVPLISDYVPENLLTDFTRYIRILLALSPGVGDLGGPIFATVGVIPSTEIVNGYATTDPSYTLYVVDAPFGGTLNIFGHFPTLTARGAKYYQVLARRAGTGAYEPLRLTWSNYRWEVDRFVLRQIAPDSQDRYEIPPASEIWSLRDILVRWPTGGLTDGLWELKVKLFDASLSELPEPTPAEGNRLALMLDNTPPRVLIDEVTHGTETVGRCDIVDLGPPPDGLRFRITAVDYSGHLSYYRLVAHYGDNDSQLIGADTYAGHMTPSKLWHGVASHTIPAPPAQWRAPEPCAYQFRLTAYNRTTNGYTSRIHGAEYNKHTTILLAGSLPIPMMLPTTPEVAPPGLNMEAPTAAPGPIPPARLFRQLRVR
jgi:hypothetical protein